MNDGTRKDTRRLALLDAAGELLALQPSASLAEIADHAKIGKATLHRYFASREELILALAFRALDVINEAVQASDLARGTVPEALLRLTETLIPVGDKFHFLLSESAPDTNPDFIAANALTEAPIQTLLQRGQQEGTIRADLSPQWMMYVMNFLLFATWQAVYDGNIARKEAPHLLVTTLLGGLGAQSPPTA